MTTKPRSTPQPAAKTGPATEASTTEAPAVAPATEVPAPAQPAVPTVPTVPAVEPEPQPEPPVEDEDPNRVEIWEQVGPGTTWVTTTDSRGRDLHVSVGRNGATRLRIRTADRQYNQDINPDNNPFINGRLRRVDGTHGNDVQPAKTDAQVLGLLQLGDRLEAALTSESELVVRRLAAMAEDPTHAERFNVAQHQLIRAVIADRWPQQGPPSLQKEIINESFED